MLSENTESFGWEINTGTQESIEETVKITAYKTCTEILDRLGLLNLKGAMLTEDGKLAKDTIQAIINETGIKC